MAIAFSESLLHRVESLPAVVDTGYDGNLCLTLDHLRSSFLFPGRDKVILQNIRNLETPRRVLVDDRGPYVKMTCECFLFPHGRDAHYCNGTKGIRLFEVGGEARVYVPNEFGFRFASDSDIKKKIKGRGSAASGPNYPLIGMNAIRHCNLEMIVNGREFTVFKIGGISRRIRKAADLLPRLFK